MTVVVLPQPVLAIAAYRLVADLGPQMSYTASAIGEPEEMPLKELVLLRLGKSLLMFLIDIVQIFELYFEN